MTSSLRSQQRCRRLKPLCQELASLVEHIPIRSDARLESVPSRLLGLFSESGYELGEQGSGRGLGGRCGHQADAGDAEHIRARGCEQ
jgi:hypothetical protein